MEIIKNRIYSELLSQGNYLRLNKRLIAVLGLEMAVFMSFLIDKYDYYTNNNLLNGESFYFTDNDILIFTGLNSNKIQKLKEKGEKLNLFSIKKLGNPAKTYYTINFETINNIFMLEKSVEELAYERIFNEKIDMNNVSYETLISLSRKELQLFCKKKKIKYFGKYTKDELIQNILNNINLNELEKISSDNIFENISEKTVRELREVCKNLNISYTGNDNKKSLIEKITLQKLVDDSVTKNIGNKCTEKLVTSDQKNWYNQYQITITNKQEQNHNHDVNDMEELKKLFVEWNINFTQKNQNSINKLLKTMSYQEVKSYLIEILENLKSNPEVIDIPALFSAKIAKGERQSKFISQKTDKKELGEDKKEWLKYFSGICSDKNLKAEIENIIADISFEVLRKNKSKLSRLEIFDFKSALYQLKNQNLQL